MWFLEVFASLVVFVILIAMGIWQCAKVGLFWIFLPENWIIILERGRGNPVKILGVNPRSFKWLNIYWVGLPPINVYKFPLLHTRFNPKGEESKDWITSDETPVDTDHLEQKVTHWVYLPQVDFSDGKTANVLLQYDAIFRTEEGVRTAVFVRKGKFFPYVDTLLEAEALAIFRNMTYKEFQDSDLSSGNQFDKDLTRAVEPACEGTSGLTVTSVFVFRYEPGDKAQARLQRMKAEAEIERDVAILRAEGDVADIKLATQTMKDILPSADHNVIAEQVGGMTVASRYAKSNIQAVGGGAGVVLPPKSSGNKKRRKN